MPRFPDASRAFGGFPSDGDEAEEEEERGMQERKVRGGRGRGGVELLHESEDRAPEGRLGFSVFCFTCF